MFARQIGGIGILHYEASPTATTNRDGFITLGLMESAPVVPTERTFEDTELRGWGETEERGWDDD